MRDDLVEVPGGRKVIGSAEQAGCGGLYGIGGAAKKILGTGSIDHFERAIRIVAGIVEIVGDDLQAVVIGKNRDAVFVKAELEAKKGRSDVEEVRLPIRRGDTNGGAVDTGDGYVLAGGQRGAVREITRYHFAPLAARADRSLSPLNAPRGFLGVRAELKAQLQRNDRKSTRAPFLKPRRYRATSKILSI